MEKKCSSLLPVYILVSCGDGAKGWRLDSNHGPEPFAYACTVHESRKRIVNKHRNSHVGYLEYAPEGRGGGGGAADSKRQKASRTRLCLVGDFARGRLAADLALGQHPHMK